MADFQKADLEKIFSGIPKDKLEFAMKKADALSTRVHLLL